MTLDKLVRNDPEIVAACVMKDGISVVSCAPNVDPNVLRDICRSIEKVTVVAEGTGKVPQLMNYGKWQIYVAVVMQDPHLVGWVLVKRILFSNSEEDRKKKVTEINAILSDLVAEIAVKIM
ncbi:MAG: hypothetical protein WED05_01290 [Candidatus Atabeyarchaeum deiterrae]